MPLSVNVGLSRKASKDYQSAGVSINVTAELDQSLLARPRELQEQIDALYRQAESALDRRTAGLTEVQPPDMSHRDRGPRRDRADASYPRDGNGRGGGAMTESQRRAINAIASRLGIDPHLEARDIIGGELAELSIRQASELIDHLKGLSPVVGTGRRGTRGGGGSA